MSGEINSLSGRATANAAADLSTSRPIRIVHIIHRLDVGGLENGLVNLINSMPPERFQHVIVCLTCATEFQGRIYAPDVEVVELGKRTGQDLTMYLRLWRTLRRTRPDIVHTRNLGTLDCALTVFVAGVRCHVHGEHGREKDDPRGERRKAVWLRRLHRPFIKMFVTMSRDLQSWMHQRVGIPETRLRQIYNGVDTQRFAPTSGPRPRLSDSDIVGRDAFVIGAVGRFDPIKAPLVLVKAFVDLLSIESTHGKRCRLVYVGDGPELAVARELLAEAGVEGSAWLPGKRNDVALLMRSFDLFVLPSRGEGVSNTVLEAMASGLPVVATAVGGNPELVEAGVTGVLVPPDDPAAICAAIQNYLHNPSLLDAHGLAGRARVEKHFSLARMVDAYADLYDSVCLRSTGDLSRTRVL